MDRDTPVVGRPRSEAARVAVLHAVDDLLVEVGYAAMTMKGIAERAGVGRQTIYRWWSTKAEILLEATRWDARSELAVRVTGNPIADVTAYLDALAEFLSRSPAGLAYRALLAAAQQDEAVATLVAGHDVLGASARTLLASLSPLSTASGEHAASDAAARDREVAQLVGPTLFWVMSGKDPADLDTAGLARAVLHQS